jgi:hypothetical protein
MYSSRGVIVANLQDYRKRIKVKMHNAMGELLHTTIENDDDELI